MSRNYSAIQTVFLACILCWSLNAHAEVIVHDAVTVSGSRFMLKAQTKGMFFPRGGEIVEFIVNGTSAGKTLSGGDGYAFLEYVPEKRTLYIIKARSDGEEGEGLLLSLGREDKVILIDVEGSVLEDLFSMKPREYSQDAIEQISRRFPIVYLITGMLGSKPLKEWLEKNSFRNAPVIRWEKGTVLTSLKDRGIQIKAVIGSAMVIESVKRNKIKLLSFDDIKGVEKVKDWKEIAEKLE